MVEVSEKKNALFLSLDITIEYYVAQFWGFFPLDLFPFQALVISTDFSKTA